MAKTKVSQWSATPANNTDIANIDIAEGCAPSGINNAIREIMAQVKDMQTGADGDDFNVGGDLYVADDATIADTLIVQNATIINGTLRTEGMHFANGGVTGNVTGNVSGTSANVTGTVAVANGGTGLTTLTANNVMLGNGTSTPAFVAPGTSGNVLTSNGTTWTSATPAGGIGDGQTLQSLTGSRAFGTTYTNSTGKPIFVMVSASQSGSGAQVIYCSLNGATPVIIAYSVPNTGGFPSITANIIVPIGNTYNITVSGGGLLNWAELR
jgi:hypothetical protein